MGEMKVLDEATQSDSETAKVINQLRSLKEHHGWKIIKKAVEEDIAEVEAKLHREVEMKEHETFDTLNDRRDDLLGMLNLPDYIIGRIEQNPEERENFDPYE